jgi:hypothetical protein
MGRYVPRSGWAEQKTSRESCCGKTAIHHTCQPEFRRAKNCSFALRRLGQNREAKRVRRSLPLSHSGVDAVFVNTSAFLVTYLVKLPPSRHPTEIADSTLPSLWSNADFRRANIALSDGGSITPCLAEVLRLSKL